MGEFVAQNMLGWFKKINKWKSCCILLVVYIVEQIDTDIYAPCFLDPEAIRKLNIGAIWKFAEGIGLL